MNRSIWIGKRTIIGDARSMMVATEGIRNHDALLLATWIGDREVPPGNTIRSQDWNLELQRATGEALFPPVGSRTYPPHVSASGAKLVRKDLEIPHWLLLAVYLAFWALGFLLRERRLKRATRERAR
jgi:hypothetical protein